MACLPSTGVLQGVTTDAGRVALAQHVLGPLVRPPFAESYGKYFKIGTGGFLLGPGGTKSPKTPDPSLTDVEAATLVGGYFFQRDFAVADLDFDICEGVPFAIFRVFLDFTDANDDGFGNAPEFFEIGIFDPQDVMLFYTTFPGETKNPAKSLNHFVYVNF